MFNLFLNTNEIIELWSMQPSGSFKKQSKFILGNIWVPLVLLLFPLISTKFEKKSLIISLVFTVIYLVYGFITAAVCAPWRRRPKLWIKKSTLSILLLAGFNSFSLTFMSIIMLAMALITVKNLGNHEGVYDFILTLYILVLISSLIIAPFLIRKGIIAHHSQLSKTYKIPIFLMGGPGFGVFLGSILSRTKYAMGALIASYVFGALLLAPFGMIKLYEAIVLSLNWDKADLQ